MKKPTNRPSQDELTTAIHAELNVDGMLLYAQTDESILPNDMQKLKDGNRLFFKTLNLAVAFDEIKRQLENIVGL